MKFLRLEVLTGFSIYDKVSLAIAEGLGKEEDVVGGLHSPGADVWAISRQKRIGRKFGILGDNRAAGSRPFQKDLRVYRGFQKSRESGAQVTLPKAPRWFWIAVSNLRSSELR